MPLDVYFKSIKARENPRLERLKACMRLELGRPLTEHEEHLIELSATILSADQEEPDIPTPDKAA